MGKKSVLVTGVFVVGVCFIAGAVFLATGSSDLDIKGLKEKKGQLIDEHHKKINELHFDISMRLADIEKTYKNDRKNVIEKRNTKLGKIEKTYLDEKRECAREANIELTKIEKKYQEARRECVGERNSSKEQLVKVHKAAIMSVNNQINQQK